MGGEGDIGLVKYLIRTDGQEPRQENLLALADLADRLQDSLEAMVEQHCSLKGVELASIGLPVNRRALRLLAELGRLECFTSSGKWPRYKWKGKVPCVK